MFKRMIEAYKSRRLAKAKKKVEKAFRNAVKLHFRKQKELDDYIEKRIYYGSDGYVMFPIGLWTHLAKRKSYGHRRFLLKGEFATSGAAIKRLQELRRADREAELNAKLAKNREKYLISQQNNDKSQ